MAESLVPDFSTDSPYTAGNLYGYATLPYVPVQTATAYTGNDFEKLLNATVALTDIINLEKQRITNLEAELARIKEDISQHEQQYRQNLLTMKAEITKIIKGEPKDKKPLEL